MIESTDHYSVYLMTREPSRDDTATVNVRHILFMPDAEDADTDAEDADTETETEAKKTLEDCRTTAEEVLAEWESGDKSEESFAALAEEYTEDPGSKSNGGLYEGVSPGQMVQQFNDWCFDTSRKVKLRHSFNVFFRSGLTYLENNCKKSAAK